jgi:putative transcriptional regulator
VLTRTLFVVGSAAKVGTMDPMSSVAPGFLVAAPILRDPHFAGSVVLMVEHSEQGALGFIVNRVAKRGLRLVLDQLGIGDTPVTNEIPVMVGGPVSPKTGWIVFTSRLGVSASKQFLVDAVRGQTACRAMLVHGYAGWGPGQLEDELRAGSWIPVDLDARVIFETLPQSRWTAALAVLGIHPASVPRTHVAQA